MACVESDYSMARDESDFEDDIFDMSDNEENVAPPSKGSKPVSKKSKKAVISILSPNKNAANVPASNKGKKKTVEEMYQKKTQLEHILIRPDTYIGSVEPVTQPMFVLDEASDRIVNRQITFTPGLFKIFDESKYAVCPAPKIP
jgi:DNA topoisomerase-2